MMLAPGFRAGTAGGRGCCVMMCEELWMLRQVNGQFDFNIFSQDLACRSAVKLGFKKRVWLTF